GELPSRVVDNLFWLGRYAERAESSARLLRTTMQLISSEDGDMPAIPALVRALADSGQIEPGYAIAELTSSLPQLESMLPEAVFDIKLPRSLRSTINEAVRLASIVRDRLALDAWRILHKLDHTARRPKQKFALDATDVLEVLDSILTDLVAFAGLAGESMTRTQSWRFLDLGRRLERAYQTSSALRAMLTEVQLAEDDSPVLEAALLTQDSLMTYRSRYLANMQLPAALDLLITDDTNPRSIIFQLARIVEHIDNLPRDANQAQLGPEQRLALALYNGVRLADVSDLIEADSSLQRVKLDRLLRRIGDQLPKLSDVVSSRFLIHAGLARHFGSRTMGL
ncbi:MAG: alpha-E domain-containing protein, partial [Planctomycetales bacterium]|nr:alpha-E domain-containing protein [Planctomycetales bacterium]